MTDFKLVFNGKKLEAERFERIDEKNYKRVIWESDDQASRIIERVECGDRKIEYLVEVCDSAAGQSQWQTIQAMEGADVRPVHCALAVIRQLLLHLHRVGAIAEPLIADGGEHFKQRVVTSVPGGHFVWSDVMGDDD